MTEPALARTVAEPWELELGLTARPALIWTVAEPWEPAALLRSARLCTGLLAGQPLRPVA